MSKIIFLDVDGTLVDYHNRVPASAVKQFNKRVKMDIMSLFARGVVVRKCSLNCGKLVLMA